MLIIASQVPLEGPPSVGIEFQRTSPTASVLSITQVADGLTAHKSRAVAPGDSIIAMNGTKVAKYSSLCPRYAWIH